MENEVKLREEIRSGKPDSFNRILPLYEKMIWYIIRKYDLTSGAYIISSEDLYQEGCLALYHACLSFKDERNVKFSSYAYLLIKRKIDARIRSQRHQMRPEIFSVDEVHQIDYFANYASDENEWIIEQPETVDQKLQKIRQFSETLRDDERAIIELRRHNSSYQEIAERLGISAKTVDNRLFAIRKRYHQSQK